MPVAGSYGLEGDAKSSRVAKVVAAVADLNVLDVSAGFAHVAYIVSTESADAAVAEKKLASFPILPAPVAAAVGGKKRSGASDAKGSSKKGKK